MWNVYLMRAYDIAAERRRESEREGRVRELRRAMDRGPRPMTRRQLDRETAG